MVTTKPKAYLTMTSGRLQRCRLVFLFSSMALLLSFGAGLFPAVADVPFLRFDDYYYYFFIGIFAATVANSTGAGGGIVFLPVFIGLGMQANESLATSLAIQCFGMSSGAFAWLVHRRYEHSEYIRQWADFPRIVIVGSGVSIAGLLAAQTCMPHPPIDVELLFSTFSLAVGVVILLRTLIHPKEKPGREQTLSLLEWAGLMLTCFIGGAVTAWLSVGVGEVLAIYLIFLGFRVNMAIAAAVCVTALSVLASMPHHIASAPLPVRIDVLVYAAPGALVGGALAKAFAVYLGAHRVKLMMSLWIIVSASIYLLLILT